VEAGTGRTGGARGRGPAYRPQVKHVLLIFAIVVGAAVGTAAQRATAQTQTPSGCAVPRLYALTLPAAEARLTAAGCRLGGIAFERPRARVARITGQVPAPGAMLPRRARVSLLVS
jgi:beta-lactam-binding protein with PASTA domain